MLENAATTPKYAGREPADEAGSHILQQLITGTFPRLYWYFYPWQFTFDLDQGHQVIQLACDLVLHRWEHMRVGV